MQINNLPTSQITEAKPSASAAVADPPKPANGAKPIPGKAPIPAAKAAAAPPAKAPPPKVEAAAAATAGTKTEITDVKPTGEENAEGDPTFTLKVNGQEFKATQSEIIALAQKAKGAEKALKDKAEIEKEITNFLNSMDNDLHGILVKRYGPEKAKEIEVKLIRDRIAEEEKDPKDRELDELRASKKELESRQEAAKKEQEDAVKRQKQTVLYKQMLTEIDTCLNETHLPKDKLTLTRVLNYLAAGKKANGVAWTIKDAVQAVEVEDMGHASHYARQYVEGKLPSEKFRSMFGDDAIKKLNKEQIDLLKNADKIAKNKQPQSETGTPAQVTPRRTLSKNRGSEGMSEREYRRTHGSLGGI